MKSIHLLISNAFQEAKKKKFDHIVIAVDLHNTIIFSGDFNKEIDDHADLKTALNKSISVKAIEALQKISLRKDIELMLFSGTDCNILQALARHLSDDYNISFVHINEYIADDMRLTQNFNTKPYFSVLLDDKAGFDIITDWDAVKLAIDRFSINNA